MGKAAPRLTGRSIRKTIEASTVSVFDRADAAGLNSPPFSFMSCEVLRALIVRGQAIHQACALANLAAIVDQSSLLITVEPV